MKSETDHPLSCHTFGKCVCFAILNWILEREQTFRFFLALRVSLKSTIPMGLRSEHALIDKRNEPKDALSLYYIYNSYFLLLFEKDIVAYY